MEKLFYYLMKKIMPDYQGTKDRFFGHIEVLFPRKGGWHSLLVILIHNGADCFILV